MFILGITMLVQKIACHVFGSMSMSGKKKQLFWALKHHQGKNKIKSECLGK